MMTWIGTSQPGPFDIHTCQHDTGEANKILVQVTDINIRICVDTGNYLHENLTVTHLVKKCPALMEPRGSLLCSQKHSDSQDSSVSTATDWRVEV
jgi:hypothetical protein